MVSGGNFTWRQMEKDNLEEKNFSVNRNIPLGNAVLRYSEMCLMSRHSKI